MAVRKQCKAKGCKASPRCEHPWWFDVMYRGKRYRMPVDAFALARGAAQPVTSKQEAEKLWEPRFIGEIVAGKDPRRPPAPPSPEGMSVADFLDQYYERYVVAEGLRSVASIRSRIAALKDALRTLPVAALERTETIEEFKRQYGQTRSIAGRVSGHDPHGVGVARATCSRHRADAHTSPWPCESGEARGD